MMMVTNAVLLMSRRTDELIGGATGQRTEEKTRIPAKDLGGEALEYVGKEALGEGRYEQGGTGGERGGSGRL